MTGRKAPELPSKLVKWSALFLNNNNLHSDSAVVFVVQPVSWMLSVSSPLLVLLLSHNGCYCCWAKPDLQGRK